MRLLTDDDGVARCSWCGTDPVYVQYHDDEWGHEVLDDVHLFEKFCLEGFQSGLAWITILRKRPAFRAAFAGFDIPAVAAFGEADVQRLLADAGIVRHRGKIQSTINNAQRALQLLDEFGSIHAYVSRFRPDHHPQPTLTSEFRALTPESTAMSKDLKRRGWSFVGPTTMYAFMQAMGLVNDHIEGCERQPS
ncbi:MAG: DNA-3-methyladenine glycosylase I [Actinomycetota bacterium]|nr:DNA-3-methyladenine glycosylase I [Actinomycetota bacterium]